MRFIRNAFWLSALVSTALLVTGCERNQEVEKPSSDISQDDQIMRELSSEPVKVQHGLLFHSLCVFENYN